MKTARRAFRERDHILNQEPESPDRKPETECLSISGGESINTKREKLGEERGGESGVAEGGITGISNSDSPSDPLYL